MENQEVCSDTEYSRKAFILVVSMVVACVSAYGAYTLWAVEAVFAGDIWSTLLYTAAGAVLGLLFGFFPSFDFKTEKLGSWGGCMVVCTMIAGAFVALSVFQYTRDDFQVPDGMLHVNAEGTLSVPGESVVRTPFDVSGAIVELHPGYRPGRRFFAIHLLSDKFPEAVVHVFTVVNIDVHNAALHALIRRCSLMPLEDVNDCTSERVEEELHEVFSTAVLAAIARGEPLDDNTLAMRVWTHLDSEAMLPSFVEDVTIRKVSLSEVVVHNTP